MSKKRITTNQPILCTRWYLYIVASWSKVRLHIVLVKAEYSVVIKYTCYACTNYRKNNMASTFNLPQHSLLVPFLEGFEKIFLGMEYFNSSFGHFQIIALRFDQRNGNKQKASIWSLQLPYKEKLAFASCSETYIWYILECCDISIVQQCFAQIMNAYFFPGKMLRKL